MSIKKLRIENFYKYVDSHRLTPILINEATGYDRGNLSKVLNKKLSPSTNLLDTFEKSYNVNLSEENSFNYTLDVKNVIKTKVPYYDIDYAGGWSSEEVFTNQLPSFFITSPDFEKADFACNLIGQSISRRIPHRAVIGLRQINDWELYFPTNEVYAVLMKNELRTVKIVKRSEKEGFLTLIPDPLPEYNQTVYEPEEVPMNFVSKMFQIVAWAQFERVAM